MKIATFNVRDLKEDSCLLERLTQLREIISVAEADIVCLQEIGSADLLKQITPDYEYQFIGAADMRGIASAMVSKVPLEFSNIPFDLQLSGYVTQEALGELTKYPGRSCVQGVTTYKGRPLTVLGVHLKSSGPMSVRDSNGVKLESNSHLRVAQGRFRTGIQKLAQAYFLRAYADRIFQAHGSEAQLVIAGDFNDYEFSLLHHIIQGDAKYFGGPGLLSSTVSMISEESRFTHIKDTGAKRFIDGVLLSESLKNSVISVAVENSHLVFDIKWSELVSDHALLSVTLA